MSDRRLAKNDRDSAAAQTANVLGLGLLGYLALSGILSFLMDGWAAQRGETLQTAVALARYALSLLLPFALAAGMTPAGAERRPHRGKRPDRAFGAAALAAGLGTACLGNLLSWLMQLTAARNGLEIAGSAPLRQMSLPAMLCAFVGYSLLAAVVEEVVFRGMILRMLRPWGDVWAIWCSAVLFALCHASALQTIPALLTGAVLGALTVMTGGIGLPVAVHTCYNAVALVFNFLLEGGHTPVHLALGAWVVFIIGGLAALPRMAACWRACSIAEGRPGRKNFYKAPVMAAAVLVMALRVIAGSF